VSRTAVALTVILLVGLSLPAAAVSLNPLTIIKGAVEAVVEDRSSEDIATDLEINGKITAAIADKLTKKVIAIDVDVYEQDVMLTGAVEEKKHRDEAAKLARAVDGVKKVYNEILVIPPVDREKGAVENFVDDNVIETKINALFIDAEGVNATNFRWRAVQGHVFLFGRALSQAEREKAARIARGVEGVKTVTNRTKVKPKS
jgi:hyperosmotically inducible protein